MVPNECFCGADGRATCLQCGQRRCETHYFHNVYSYNVGMFTSWAATTLRGRLELPFLAAWDKAVREAYATGGSACITCREAAADAAKAKRASEVAEHIRSYLKGPSLASFMQLADATNYITSADLEKMLAAAWPHLLPGNDLITMRIDAERCGFGKNRVRATATVIAREPAVKFYMMDAALVDGGRLLLLSKTGVGARTDGSSVVRCIVGREAVPGVVCHKAYRDEDGALSGPSVGLSFGHAVIENTVTSHADYLANARQRLLGDLDSLGRNLPWRRR
jgi:hypothetical protein